MIIAGDNQRTAPLAGACIYERGNLLLGASEAVFSASRAYRYRLSRTWGDPSRRVMWIMLNPSTADALADDPTIRRCTGFSKAWGFGGLVVVNLFALRATDPRELAAHARPAGRANDQFIGEAADGAALVVAAWGAHPAAADRAGQVTRLVTGKGIDLMCLGVTKAGHPKHPLYVRKDAALVPYRRGEGVA